MSEERFRYGAFAATRVQEVAMPPDDRAVVKRNAVLAEKICIGRATPKEIEEYLDLRVKLDPILIRMATETK